MKILMLKIWNKNDNKIFKDLFKKNYKNVCKILNFVKKGKTKRGTKINFEACGCDLSFL